MHATPCVFVLFLSSLKHVATVPETTALSFVLFTENTLNAPVFLVHGLVWLLLP